jgi:hypothetical protein
MTFSCIRSTLQQGEPAVRAGINPLPPQHTAPIWQQPQFPRNCCTKAFPKDLVPLHRRPSSMRHAQLCLNVLSCMLPSNGHPIARAPLALCRTFVPQHHTAQQQSRHPTRVHTSKKPLSQLEARIKDTKCLSKAATVFMVRQHIHAALSAVLLPSNSCPGHTPGTVGQLG